MSYFSLHVRAFVRGEGETSIAKRLDQGNSSCPQLTPREKTQMDPFRFCLVTLCSPNAVCPGPSALTPHAPLLGTKLRPHEEHPLSFQQTIILLPLSPPLAHFAASPKETPSLILVCRKGHLPFEGNLMVIFSKKSQISWQVSVFSLCIEFVTIIIRHISISFASILPIYMS